MITGAHTVVYSRDADADRAFFRDVLDLPAAEAAVHPAEQGGTQELYLMCDDVHATVAQLMDRGAEFSREVSDEGWGLVTAIRLPSGAELHLYEPRHPTP